MVQVVGPVVVQVALMGVVNFPLLPDLWHLSLLLLLCTPQLVVLSLALSTRMGKLLFNAPASSGYSGLLPVLVVELELTVK